MPWIVMMILAAITMVIMINISNHWPIIKITDFNKK
jgi:hypothetical protein